MKQASSKFWFIKPAGITLFLMIFLAPGANAKVSGWQKGVSLYPEINNDFASQKFQQSLLNAKAMGANTAIFIIPYYQTAHESADMQKGWNTPTDQSLIAGINYAHSLGLQTTIKIQVSSYYGDSWAAYINPNDKTQWFANYGKLLKHYSYLAETNGVDQFCIGNELAELTSAKADPQNTAYWENLISNVRSQYHGKVFYNANWGNEKDDIAFWQDLDFVGLSAYFNLSDDLNASWQQWNDSEITPLELKVNKPILFTEIGYRSLQNSHRAPWDFADWAPYDGNEQVNDFNTLFTYWDKFDYISGMYIWNWETDPNLGGPGNTDYTPQNKPAQDLIKQWWTNKNTP